MTLVRRSFVIAAVHGVAVLTAVVAAYPLFPDDGEQSNALGTAFLALGKILASPGYPIWRAIHSRINESNAVQWVLFAGNSLLWGFALGWLVGLIGRAKSRSSE